ASPIRRRRQFVVSGGYAASDSSLPAKMNVATPDVVIVAAHTGKSVSRLAGGRLRRNPFHQPAIGHWGFRTGSMAYGTGTHKLVSRRS
ncbi:hypothetical protein ACTJLC_21900, partial [Paraburkholderia sp. 22099]|uniref:hypothetical protein n=1 Tax=Paraburkholderia sp. 22099 TaxID=3453875 RepID=UPI003F836BC2